MKPQKQGDHDGACGFYAVGNALKLLFPKLDIDDIFKEIFSIYFQKLGNGKHLIEGTNRSQLSMILKGVIENLGLNVSVSTPFWNCSARSLREFKTVLADHLSKEKTAAIVSYFFYKDESNGEDCGHWTVLKSTTEKTIFTFDSSHAKSRIRFGEIRITKEQTPHIKRPYLFRSTELFLLRRETIV